MSMFGRVVLTIATLCELSRWTFELAGDPALNLGRKGQPPKSVRSLQKECGNKLQEEIYRVFGRAVRYHQQKDFESAYTEYRKLRRIPLRDGTTLDLFNFSKVFRYNWGLLLEDMKN